MAQLKYEYEIKGNYGHGWELLTTEPDIMEARKQLITYNENEPEYRHKVVRHQIKINDKPSKYPKFGSGAGSGK